MYSSSCFSAGGTVFALESSSVTIIEQNLKLDDVDEYCDEYHNGELGEATEDYLPLEGALLNFYNANFGDPEVLKQCQDNLDAVECGDLRYEQQYKVSVWPCGEQIAYRRYRAKDWSDNYSSWVEQKITITYRADWKITLPADWEGHEW